MWIHPTSIVDPGVVIGAGTKVWQWTHVCEGAVIGENCMLGQNVYIGPRVKIGNNVRLQNNVFIPEGVEIEDEVFIGPAVVFTNDRYPPSPKDCWEQTLVRKGAAIGANATVLCGLTIGADSMVGAGSVVVTDVPAEAVVYGNPAREHPIESEEFSHAPDHQAAF